MPAVVMPLIAGQNQSFSVTLPVDSGNIALTFQFTWNGQGEFWWMSITQAGILLLDGIPVVAGNYPGANILRQYAYLQIGSAYLIANGGGLPENPTFTTLGTQTPSSTSAPESTYQLIWTDNVGYVGG